MTVATEKTGEIFLDIVEAVPCSNLYPLFAETEVTVLYGKAGLTAILNVDYTVELNSPTFESFTITPLASLISKIDALIALDLNEINTITVRRSMNYTTNVQPETVRGAAFLSREIDRIHLKMIQLNESLLRTIRLSPTVIGSEDEAFYIDPAIPGALVAWNSDGTKLVNGPTADELLAGIVGSRQPNYWNIVGSTSGPVSATATGEGETVGANFYTKGTTTTGSQIYNNKDEAGENTSGDYIFHINGRKAFRITDTWWNANIAYGGACTTNLVASSAALAGGPDTTAVLGVESSLYKRDGSGSASGVSIRYVALGLTSQHHTVNNGWINFTVEGGQANPSGVNDTYALSSYLNVRGAPVGGSRDNVAISNQSTYNTGAPHLIIYNSGAGNMTFSSDNTTSALFKMNRVANGVNGIYVTAAATGGVPILGAGFTNGIFSPDANCSLGVAANGSGSFYVYNAAGASTLARFNSSGVVLGHTALIQIGSGGPVPRIEAVGTDVSTSSIANVRYSADSNSARYISAKSRGAAAATQTAVIAADGLASYEAWGSDGTNFQRATQILAYVGSTISAGVVSGKYQFNTANSVGVLAQALLLDDNQNVIVGKGSIATNATSGFLCIPSCAGTPTGVPAGIPAGWIPLIYNTVDDKIYAYDSGWAAV